MILLIMTEFAECQFYAQSATMRVGNVNITFFLSLTMDNSTKLVASMLLVSVVIGIAAFFILGFLMGRFYVANPGISNINQIDYIVSSGIAASAFSIVLLLYPVYKRGISNGDWEDYR